MKVVKRKHKQIAYTLHSALFTACCCNARRKCTSLVTFICICVILIRKTVEKLHRTYVRGVGVDNLHSKFKRADENKNFTGAATLAKLQVTHVNIKF